MMFRWINKHSGMQKFWIDVVTIKKSTCMTEYYTDIDRDGHEISRFGGLPRELYFPKGLYFPEARSAEGKYNHEGKYNYLGTTDTWYFIRPVNIWYIRWSKWMISSKFDGVLWLSRSSVTRLGVCVHNNVIRKLPSLARFLLWRSIV